jgi:hypothetical protein
MLETRKRRRRPTQRGKAAVEGEEGGGGGGGEGMRAAWLVGEGMPLGFWGGCCCCAAALDDDDGETRLACVCVYGRGLDEGSKHPAYLVMKVINEIVPADSRHTRHSKARQWRGPPSRKKKTCLASTR